MIFSSKIEPFLFSVALSFASIVTLVGSAAPAKATGVIGGYKYVRACNHGWGSSIRVTSTAYKTFGSIRIHYVSHKVSSSQRFSNPWWGYTNNVSWRSVNGSNATNPNGEGEYTTNQDYPLTWFNKDKDVMISQHVYRTVGGVTNNVFDPGGIVNLGKIEPNSCREYSNGQYSGW
jgi:hypothetical protein